MKFVLLWTDYFVYLLVLMALGLVYYISRDAPLRQKWRRILYRPLNMVATILLLSYVVIGLADSVHFIKTNKANLEHQYNPAGIFSLLDEILATMALNTESTYSAPFATHAFSKEPKVLDNGEIVRDYPRLVYGGAHLSDLDKKGQDIRARIFEVLLISSTMTAIFSLTLIWIRSRKYQLSWRGELINALKGRTAFPWRTFILTLFLISFSVIFVWDFMPFYHIFGTNQVGEDVLYQALKSVRTGLIIGTLTTLVMLPFAIFFGMIAGYFRGWLDDIVQYVYTTLSSIPGVLLIAAAVLTLQIVMGRHADWFKTAIHSADARLLALCAILGITSWTGLCRLLRGETLKISQMDYVQAAHSLGTSNFSILIKHILPNVFHIVLITIALDFSGLVLAEAVLSYVGVGVDPSSYSWGTMINSARLEMARQPVVWWSLAAAFVFMFVLVLAANIFADAVRDAFDPQTDYSGVK